MRKSQGAVLVALVGGALLVTGRARGQSEAPPPPILLESPDVASPYRPAGMYTANRGPQLGARLGYTTGTGVVYSGLQVRDASHGALPLVVDLGWRILPELYAGFYGQYAAVFVENNPVSCPDGFDCQAQDWRLGVEFDYHFVPRTRIDPYVGLGGGYEVLHNTVNGPVPVPTPLGEAPGRTSVSTVDRGWEFATLTLGFDARVNSELGIGPFISASLNEFGVRTGTQVVNAGGTQVQNGPPADVTHGLHELYTAGLRGTFNP